jgi:2-succinyl-5-enolpyruvyl-6-hydroxy-3-cyclohexene-1-carboxylate synthase
MKFDNISHLWASVIIDQCVKSGVSHFYCCPGMRNAPLLRAINEHENAHHYSGHDERSQSYRALGFIKSSGKAAALVCTSGTAVANFLPAVIEAQKTQLPLLILSADRPGELNAVDANQTINQVEILRDYTKTFSHLSEPQENYPLEVLAGHLAHLLHQTQLIPSGPVHLNIPLREPLDQTIASIAPAMKDKALQLCQQVAPSLSIKKAQHAISDDDANDIAQLLSSAKRPLVIFAPLKRQKNNQIQLIEKFVNTYKGLYYCDVETGGKFYFGSHDQLIPSFDHPEVLDQLIHYKPDLIIHFGHRLTSKHYYKFLNQHVTCSNIIQVVQSHQHQDPGFSFNKRYDCDPLHVLDKLSLRLESLPNYQTITWDQLITKKETVIETGALSYAYLSKKAIETLTNACQFFIGNSTFIRSFDSYTAIKAPKRKIDVYANRGASGIEGHLSTTLGIVEGQNQATVLFLGDVSMIHDATALFQLSELSKHQDLPLLIVIANNQGGGIFKLLPIRNDERTLPLVTTPHQHQFTALLKSMGLKSSQVTSKKTYQEALEKWNKSPTLSILEVMINDDDNFKVYQQLKTVKL